MSADLMKEELDQELYEAFRRHKAGEFEYAFETYSRILKKNPENKDALHYMGLLAQQTGRTDEAIKLITRSLEIDKNNQDALNHLGQSYVSRQEFVTAEQCFRQVLEMNSEHFYALNNLANCLKRDGYHEAAIHNYKKAMVVEPRNTISIYNLGILYVSLGKNWEAIDLLTRVIAMEPKHHLAHHQLGVAYEQVGEFDRANINYASALRNCPTHYESLAALLNSPEYSATIEDVQKAELSLKEGEIKDDTRLKLDHALGKFYEKNREYVKAFAHYRSSNEIQKALNAPFDKDYLEKSFSEIIEFYSESVVRELTQFGNHNLSPIFVVGMPRTGTTLTEQILSSHSACFGAGELKYIQKFQNKLFLPVSQGGLMDEKNTRPILTRETIHYLSESYVDSVKSDCAVTDKRVVDKFPMNFINLGLIAILFPNAKIVHCRRDPLDVAISCYSVLFKMTNDFSNDLMAFGEYYIQYLRMMDHWRKILPTSILEQNYETLVQHPQENIQRLIGYCDLAWEDQCLNYVNNRRTVRTPSKWQVRQEIYNSSIGRWKKFESEFDELREILEAYR